MWWMILVGCGGPAPSPETCKEFCADDGAQAPEPAQPAPAEDAAKLTSFEKELLDPVLEDIRAGVRPFQEGSVTICEGGGKDCEKPLGLTPGELPEGEYHLQAELAVPKTGEKGTWKVQFHLECTRTSQTANGSSTSTSNQDREYTVFYAGADRGYRLSPLWKITSPGRGGEEDCKFKLTAPHPDGDKVISGSWMVPAPS